NNSITMTIGENTFYHNGEAIELDVPAQIVGDRMLVPVRAISESLDCAVNWDGDERKVIIISSPEKVTGTATINEMRCLIDYQPIDFVNVDGFTYIKATDLEDYGFDVSEENGDIYVSRNKTKLPLLIDKYKNGLVDELWFNAPVYPHVNYCHSIMHLWKEPQYGKEFDIFEAKSNAFLDGTQCNAKNINGDMYLQADELQKYGSVTWINASEWNPYVLSGDVLDVHVATDDLKNQVSEDTGEYAIFNGTDRYGVTRGIVEYKNDKINGMGYISNYYIEIPRGNIYQAGEFDDGNLKNGIIISNVPEANGDYIALYEVNDFEKTQLYPKE
ncbi:MAG: copper amine oxidase N-terminal domain-containing protein, partial [Clostridia bacterium]|nr:copper amine oxidase N-terminal domain-containing protein [Clostridia bacterium]